MELPLATALPFSTALSRIPRGSVASGSRGIPPFTRRLSTGRGMPPGKAFHVGRQGRAARRLCRPAPEPLADSASKPEPPVDSTGKPEPSEPPVDSTDKFVPSEPPVDSTDKFEPLAESASKPSALRFPNPRSYIISHFRPLGEGRIHISGLRCRGAFILGCWRPVAAFAGGSLAACCLCWPLLYIRQNTTFMREGSSKLGHG